MIRFLWLLLLTQTHFTSTNISISATSKLLLWELNSTQFVSSLFDSEQLQNTENEEQNYFSWYRDCMEDFLQLVCNGRFKISCIINVFQLQEGQFFHLLWPAHSRFSPYLNKLNLCDAGASPEGRNQMASCSLSLKKWTFGSLSWHNWLKLRSKSVIKSFFVWQQTEFYF